MSKSKQRTPRKKRKNRFGLIGRRPLLEILERRFALDTQIGSVTMPYDGYLSAGVYDSNGQLVRTLLERSSHDGGESISLRWDGKDNVGRTVLNDGTYIWKALTSQVEVVDEGGVGDSVFTSSYVPAADAAFPFSFPDAPAHPQSVAIDSSGNFYVSSTYVENQTGLLAFNPDGTSRGRLPYFFAGVGTGVATDSSHLYVTGRIGDNDVVYKVDLATETFVNFTTAGGSIVVNSDPFDPRPADRKLYTKEETRQVLSVWGVAVDSNRLWVSNYRNNRIDIYDKVTGVKLDTLSASDDSGFASPLGIAVEASSTNSGTVWVVHNGSKATRYTYTVSGSNLTFTESTEITGLSDPQGIAYGGPNNHVFVTETGSSNTVREYTTGGTLTGWGAFGSKQVGGAIAANEFNFSNTAAVAIDSSGVLSVIDGNRVQRFYTVTGGGHTAGDLKQSLLSDFGGSALDTYGYTSDGKYFVMHGTEHYEVDSLYTGGPRDGWLGNGSWRLAKRDVIPMFEEAMVGPMVTRILMDGGTAREFRYVLNMSDKQSVGIYAVDPTTGALRHSVILGNSWWGSDLQGYPQAGKYLWTDSDVDGVIDWGGGTSGTSGEVVWATPLGQPSNIAIHWVDNAGNLWGTGPGSTIVKIPLQGFVNGNPVYNYASAVTVVPFTDDSYDFRPLLVRVGANGDIYASGGTNYPVYTGTVFVPGGDWLAAYDSNGNRKSLIPTPDSRIPTIAADETEATGSYFFSAHSGGDEHWGYMFSNDGLMVARAAPGAASGGWAGWTDFAQGMGGFTHPNTGKTYMFLSDVSNGKSEIYRVDNLNTVERQQGTFSWVVSPEITGRWKLDDTLQDTIGQGGAGTYFGGTPNYVYGLQGKAIDLDGVNDRLELPYAYTDRREYAISVWVKPTNTASVNIIAAAGAGGVNSANLDQLRINANGQFEHFTSSYQFPGSAGSRTSRIVTGTTVVQPGVWYHVVGVAQSNGTMRLFVNGKEEGTAVNISDFLWSGGNVLHVGSSAFGASKYLDGAVDDIRTYQSALSAEEVAALYNEDRSAQRDGYWTLDGNLNDSAGSNNATFSGGAAPTYATGMFGQAIDFDGTDDYVSALYSTDPENYTISAWVKPTDTTSVGILTRTSSAGPASVFLHQLRINSSGQFEHYTNDGTDRTVTGTTVVQPGLWYHVTGVATSGGMMRLFVNGVEEGKALNVGTLSTAGDHFYIGSSSGGGMGYFDGLIDDARVYNEAMSVMDIDDLFKNGDVPEFTGQWSFENNVSDSAGTNHGTFFGGTATYGAGKAGNAIDFDGSNDYVELPYSTDPTAYTISAWIRPTLTFDEDGILTPQNVIARTDSTGPSINVSDQLRIISPKDREDNPTANVAVFEYATRTGTGGNAIITGATKLVSNAWYHVSIVASNNGMMRLFVNGREEGTPLAIGTLVTDGDRFHLGNATKGGLGFLDGLVDELRIYERALSSEEIGSVYEGKAPADLAIIPPTVKITATDPQATEAGTNLGVFTISRDHNVGDLVVNYTVGGTATSTSDYSALSGSITIPNGQLSATVTITPVNDSTTDPSETVTLSLSTSTNYNISGAPSASVVIIDNEATGDVGWLGSNNTANGNSFNWSHNTSHAGGTAGEIGGTLARSQTDTFYGDSNLAQPLSLSSSFSASGKFDITNITAGWAGTGASSLFIGYFSTDSASREFIGLELMKDTETTLLVRARNQRPNLGGSDSENSFSPVSVAVNGNHTFSFTYDPTLGETGDPTPDGRLTLTIDSTTVYVNLGGSDRAAGSRFDAFGMGSTDNLYAESDTSKTVSVFMDDLSYTGLQATLLPTVNVAVTDAAILEHGANPGVFTISRTSSSGSLVVNYTISGTATSGTDYSALTGSVTFADGQSSVTVTVTPTNDSSAEDAESVILTLSTSANYNLGAQKTAALSIVDNEPSVEVLAADASAAEVGGNSGTFTFSRTNTSGNLVVNYTVGGTATNGSDYSTLSGSVTIADGQSSATVTITPTDDGVSEGSEKVMVEIVPNSAYRVGANNRATTIIADNEAPGDPGWTGSNNTALGNNYGWSELTHEANGVRGEIGGTFARSQVDSFYGDTNLTTTLDLNGVITASGKFDLHNLSEGWSSSGRSGLFIGHFSESSGSHEFIGLKFSEHRNDAVEVRARVQKASGIGEDLHVLILPIDGNHTFSYTYDPNQGAFGRLTVQIDSRPAMITDLTSIMRNSGIQFDAFGMGMTAGMNSENNAAKTIQAFMDDVTYTGQATSGTATVTVSASDNSATEGADTGTFTFIRNGTSGNLTVNYAISGTAANTSDYSTLSGSVTIADGQSSAAVTITPVNDSAAEGNETVILTLSPNANYFIGSPNSATVTIVDNESTVTVAATDGSATEGADTGTFTFTRVGNTSGNLIVNYSVSGTATSASDYSALSGSVTILDGQSTTTVTITPVDDGTVEPSETVIVTISTSANYFVGSPNSAAVTIVDNEPTVTVAATDPAASEQGPDTGTFTVTRAGNTSGDLVVNYSVNGTATGGSDYSALSGSVTIPNGQSSATVTVTPIDDSTGEASETVILTISSSSSYSVGTPASATVDIADNEPTVSITATDDSAAEPGANTGTITVTRTNTNGNLVVTYTVSGTATSGDDFSALSGSVTIPDGQMSATVTVTPVNDTLAEGSETVILTISSSSSYFVGTPSSATVNIGDDEPTVSVVATDSNAAEPGANPGTFTITRVGNTSGSLVVNYSVGGTAVSGSDYTALSGSVTIANGQASATVTVTPIDDVTVEGGETVILTLTPDSAYFVGTPGSDTVTIADDDSSVVQSFNSNPNWTGSNNSSSGNSFGYSSSTSHAGGSTGEVGGTFARATADAFYADTNLSQALDLDDTISASGKFDVLNITSGWAGSGAGRLTIGHLSETSGNRAFIGLEIENYDAANVMVRAHLQRPTSGNTDSDDTPFSPILISANGNHTFSYIYDPNIGTYGRLTLTVDTTTVYVDLDSTARNSGAAFDAFGMGYTSDRNTSVGSTKTVDVFMDDVEYSGQQQLPAVTISATDASAAEQAQDTGTFTVTRTNTSGNLTVNYSISGTATNTTDYSTLSGSVTILDGNSSATIVVTPVDDAAVDANETVILTLSSSANYTIGTPNNATVTIADNDSAGGGVVNFTNNPGWTGSNNATSGNSYGWSQSTSEAGGTTGEVGGTFARALVDSFFGDTNLSSTLGLSGTITGSGKFDVRNITSGWAGSGAGRLFIGHFSEAAGGKEFLGLEIENYDENNVMVRGRLQKPTGSGNDTEDQGYNPIVVSANGNHTFSYTYDPSIGTYGRLTVTIDSTNTIYVDLDSSARNSGAQFDAFGMGYTSNRNSENNSAKTVEAYIDDVSYTGLSTSGSTATVTVAASEPNAAELGAATGAFTISRSTTSGDLTVNYSLSGAASNTTDYATLSGSVVIPNGQSSATVIVTPVDDSAAEGDETVILTISSSANYTIGTANSATVTIADNDIGFNSAPAWTGSGNSTNGNSYGYSSGTSNAGGTTGEVGGTFARTQVDSYYGDTNLSQTYMLANAISAAGKFDILNISSGWYSNGSSGLFIGHFSENATNREFIGLEFQENDGTTMLVRGRIQRPGTGGSDTGWITVSTNGNHTFSYSYNPTLGEPGDPTPDGRLTLTVDSTTLSVNLGGADRNSGAAFDAFGMGFTNNLMSENASTKTAQAYIDDVSYSGYQAVVPPTVSVSAADPSAAEAGADTGTFTITRSNAIGDLTVNYTLSGTASSGSDYSSLSGSVTIPNGQTSATITVTPIDDSSAESPETVILTISTSTSYTLGSPSSATVTIADNDVNFSSNPNWTASNNATSGNSFGYSSSSSHAGGSTGEIGGTFARAAVDAYYADTNLSTTFDLDDVIKASGKFDVLNITSGWADSGAGRVSIGHMSETSGNRAFIGLEIENYDGSYVQVRAHLQRPSGGNNDSDDTPFSPILASANGNHTFNYVYDPNIGTYGRLTLTVDSTTIYVNLDSTARNSGAQFDAFGMGYTSDRNTQTGSTKTVDVYVDDVNYSGYQKVYAVDGFESGNGSGGTGWSAAWTLSGAASVVSTGTPANGSYHLQLTGNTGSAERAVDLSGVTDANLSFNWKANSFEAGETAVVEIYDGTSWITVLTVGDGQDDDIYHHASINLAGYTLNSSFKVRIRSLMSSSDDFFYVDDLQIVL